MLITAVRNTSNADSFAVEFMLPKCNTNSMYVLA